MKKIVLLSVFSFFLLHASSLKCKKNNNTITCTYFSDRSDGSKDIKLKFDWISPASPKDDRIRYILIPPYYGSAYDYRLLPGRVPGVWKVVVTRMDTNKSVKTTFDVNETGDEFFRN
jgi:hypothetical protein